jgi:hypothetical protein
MKEQISVIETGSRHELHTYELCAGCLFRSIINLVVFYKSTAL